MRLLNRKSKHAAPGAMRSFLAGGAAGKRLKGVLITIGGLAGITAASARISSLRRREEEAKDGS